MSSLQIINLSPFYVQSEIDNFISIASDIPHENWNLANYLYELPGKWAYSIAAINTSTRELLGFIIGSQKESHVHIHKFAVSSSYRSQKIGKVLLDNFETLVKQNSHTKVVGLFVKNVNDRAIQFYEKNGYSFKQNVNHNLFYEKRIPFIVAVHQPNFFPWFGFFDKIRKCDLFIYLDDAQFQKTGGNWSNRVSILDSYKSKWLTASVNRNYSGTKPINEIVFNTKVDWKKDIIGALTNAYRKAPFFKEISELLFDEISNSSDKLVDFNISMNNIICDWIAIKKDKIKIASDFNLSSKSNERLIQLTHLCSANSYMCGGGSQGYQQDELFKQAGIEVIYQRFEPIPYAQFNSNEFIPGLSIIDAAMNLGIDQLSVLFNKSI